MDIYTPYGRFLTTTPIDVGDVVNLDWHDPQLLINPDQEVTIVLKADSSGDPIDYGRVKVSTIKEIVDAYKGVKDEMIAMEIEDLIHKDEIPFRTGLFKNFETLKEVESLIVIDIDKRGIEKTMKSIRASKSATVDTSEIEFCRTASLSEIRGYLSEKIPFEQAMLIVVLEHFRPEFFAAKEQIITQDVVDLSGAFEIIEQMNSALMFCSSPFASTSAELALIKYYLLTRVKDGGGLVNLRGEHYKGWIDIKAIVSSPNGDILKMLVAIDPYQIPSELDRYVSHGLRPVNYESMFNLLPPYPIP